MADQFRYKLMTDLTAKDAPSDTDLVAVGNNGSSALRKLTFASIANAIKTKLASWTFSNLTTSSKTLPGAVNELNSKIAYENFSVQIEFEADTPSSYVGVKDISIAKTGYTPISVSLRSVPGAAGLNVYSLQFAITTGTARIAYGRDGTGAAYSNTVGISVVYIKTS